METQTETLTERVDRLVQSTTGPILSITPTSVAIGELAERTEALELALREIAREVQRLTPDD